MSEQSDKGPAEFEAAYARVREEFVIINDMKGGSDIDSSMLNVDALVTAARLNTVPAVEVRELERPCVVTRNKAEFAYMIAWCEIKGWLPPYLGEPSKYPFVVGLDFKKCNTGWTDRMDRSVSYVEFIDYLATLTQRLEH